MFETLKILKCTRNCAATGSKLPNGGFIVFKGSIIAPLETPSCPNWVKNLRNRKMRVKNGVLQEHVIFNSISAASSAVSGSSSNGNHDWEGGIEN